MAKQLYEQSPFSGLSLFFIGQGMPARTETWVITVVSTPIYQ